MSNENKPLMANWPTCPHCGVKVHLLEHRCEKQGYPAPGIFTPEQHEVIVKWFNDFYAKTAALREELAKQKEMAEALAKERWAFRDELESVKNERDLLQEKYDKELQFSFDLTGETVKLWGEIGEINAQLVEAQRERGMRR